MIQWLSDFGTGGATVEHGPHTAEWWGTWLMVQPRVCHLVHLCLTTKMRMKIPACFLVRLRRFVSPWTILKAFGDSKCYQNVFISFKLRLHEVPMGGNEVNLPVSTCFSESAKYINWTELVWGISPAFSKVLLEAGSAPSKFHLCCPPALDLTKFPHFCF